MSPGPVGATISHYRILERLGEGGMGVIYRAVDVRLERTVALKLLRPESLTDAERKRRFLREAKAASSLNHPNIVTIYEIGSEGEVDFIAMEYLEGISLLHRIASAPLPIEEALRTARGVAEGLAAAHAAGIVHRDVKPANVMLTATGKVKVLDFGLAKPVEPVATDPDAETGSIDLHTAAGVVVGTIAYMSPEQAAGAPVDARSDVFSFGVTLYELLCGRRPFEGSSTATLLSAILRDDPAPPRTLRSEIPADVERLVLRCLEKDPARRYDSAQALADELSTREARLRRPRLELPALPRHVWAAGVALVLAAGAAIAPVLLQASRERWARQEAVPGIVRLVEAGELYEAYQLALRAHEHIPNDPGLADLVARFTLPIRAQTQPAGARFEVKGYATPEAPWLLLGETPFEARVPYALMRWRISKEGFETFEGAPFGGGILSVLSTSGLPLEPAGSRPEGMVAVLAGGVQPPELPPAEVGPFHLDRFEVTNVQFQQFVDAGAYRNPGLWTSLLEEELSSEAAAALFVDSTGRSGPATWELGHYPEAREQHPVRGVSWYEAAAYCAFVGKSLPGVYHWFRARGQDQLSDILLFSNFGPDGPAPVGAHAGIGGFGNYDMAGNVKEWCWNSDGAGRRYILGGSWGEPEYMFQRLDAQQATKRGATYGFRCASYDAAPAGQLLEPLNPTGRIEPRDVLSDEAFEAVRSMYSYDAAPLEASVDGVDGSSPYWRKETVSFDAAYGGERVSALLFLPRDVAPPYQAVVWFPGDDVFGSRSSQSLASAFLFDFVPRSGRALVYPIYKGMYERFAPFSRAPNEWRDMLIMWSKDLRRTLDYLETRADFDGDRIAYYGLSAGAVYGPVFAALDDRFAASVLLGGGLPPRVPPELSIPSFAPRSQVPTLMINGRDDFIMRIDTSQRLLFEALGTPEAHKRHAVLEGGHLPRDRRAVVKETLNWLDRYLGPVDRASDSRPDPGG